MLIIIKLLNQSVVNFNNMYLLYIAPVYAHLYTIKRTLVLVEFTINSSASIFEIHLIENQKFD